MLAKRGVVNDSRELLPISGGGVERIRKMWRHGAETNIRVVTLFPLFS